MVLQKQPQNPRALVLLGNSLAGLKSLDDAVTVMQRAITVDPERAGILANLAVLQMASGSQVEAEAAFKKAVDVSGAAPDAQLALANFYRAVKRWPEAEATLITARAKMPRHVGINQALAAVYIDTGREAEAEPYLKVVVEIQKDAPSRLALATYYASANRDADAVQTLNALAAEPANFADARTQLALLHFARGAAGCASRARRDLREGSSSRRGDGRRGAAVARRESDD